MSPPQSFLAVVSLNLDSYEKKFLTKAGLFVSPSRETICLFVLSFKQTL